MGFIFPYGYRMTAGVIVEDQDKAAIVRQVFESYASGLSYGKIANQFPDEGFDKHRIKRILENDKYTGNEELPALVTEEDFQMVRELQKSKSANCSPVPPAIQVIRKNLYCDVCGDKYVRHTKKNRQWWRCTNGCGPSQVIDDELLIGSVHELLKRIKALVAKSWGKRFPIEQVFERQDCVNMDPSDVSAAYQEICERAVTAYHLCPDAYIDRMIREINRYQSSNANATCDLNLFKLAVEKVSITTQAKVKLHLCTGHVVQ